MATVLFSGVSWGQGGDDGCILLPDPLKLLIPTTIGWGDLGLNKSSGSNQLDQEAVLSFLIDVNNGVVDSKTFTAKKRAEALSDMATIIDHVKDDPKYQFVMSLANNNSNITLPGFISLLEQNKPAIFAMNNGYDYYVKLHYTLQLAQNSYDKSDYLVKIDPNSKGGPNGEIIFDEYISVSSCGLQIITGTAAGGVIGGWFGGVGAPIGAVAGAIIGIHSCISTK
ncbi:MAG: hypothetical protein H0X63_00720 [Flavobacteriales bacterium]|nr:hypothetical protein [Flavobacteriales bacterium]